MSHEDRLRSALRSYARDAGGGPAWSAVEERLGARRRHRRMQRVALGLAAAASAAGMLAYGALAPEGERSEVRPIASATAPTIEPTVAPTVAPVATAAPPAPPGMPATVVAATTDGRIVELDARTGALRRVIVTAGGIGVRGIALSPDGKTVYFGRETRECIGPPDKAGEIVAAPLDGSEGLRTIADGLYPAISPDGRRLAYSASPCDLRRRPLRVRELRTGAEREWVPEQPPEPELVWPGTIGQITWSKDSRHLAYALEYEDVTTGVLDTAADEKLRPILQSAYGRPAYRGRIGTLAIVQQCCYGDQPHEPDRIFEVDPGTDRKLGTVLERPWGTISSIDFDDSGRFLLYVTPRAELYRWSGGEPVRIASGFTAADW